MDDSSKVEAFLEWLRSNGATFPALSWPEVDPESGLRGARATKDIESNEVAIEIPAHLMMGPVQAYADPLRGAAFRNCGDILHGDLLLTFYIMSELSKGPDSFYKPYLDILPIPQCLPEWDDRDLLELQDERLSLRAKSRRRSLVNVYERSMAGLRKRFPQVFPPEEFTLERFSFAWNTVQARAFGRLLPWTALVPFADCLNHSNVQTKYSYDNHVFRWFPSGSNHYVKGQQVFNSYGRRPNDNLLLEYGFSMLDNMWEEVEVAMDLGPQSDDLLRPKRLWLAELHLSVSQIFKFDRFRCPFRAIRFWRIAQSHAGDLPTDALDVSAEYFRTPASRDLEARAVSGLHEQLLHFMHDMDGGEDTVESAIEADTARLHQVDQVEPAERRDRLASAVTYRLTRKRIVQWNLRLLSLLLAALADSGDAHRVSALAAFRSAAGDAYEAQMKGQTAANSARSAHYDEDDKAPPSDPSLDAYLAEVDLYMCALASI